MTKLSKILKGTALCAIALSTSVFAAEKIVVKGSDTLGAKLVPQLAEEFKAMKAKDGVEVIFEIAAEGSSTGIAAVIDGTADIGMASREAKTTEVSRGLVKGVKMEPITVAKDGIAIIVNEGNPMEEISAREVEKIFTGAVVSWSSVNGTSGDISIYTRNTSSGTYGAFQKMAMRNRDYAPSSQKMAGNEQIASEVGTNENGIGYVGLAYLGTKGTKVLPVDGVTPEKADYKFSRPLYYYVDGNKELSSIAQEFIDFTLSDAGQKIVKSVHFITIK
ncbi:phosphate ABC transporter substrate-binding protein [Puniceicoccaceae bacterium K14]|nr:phosphate ABC transporter substrate-binding protein [Puniceicoccaceae bacterium K14]